MKSDFRGIDELDPVLKALLLSWEWRAEVIAVLVMAGTLYTRGWWRIRQRGANPQHPGRSHSTIYRRALASGWRLAAYLCGLVVIGVALMSPIDVLGGQLFMMHMVQHKLLIIIAPPLLLIANPLPFFLWSLPVRARYAAGRLLNRESNFRRALRTLTAPGLVWMGFVAVLIGWHDPNAYNAALRNDLVHDIEHLTFFGTAMLYWWQVIGAGPRLRSLSRGMRLAFLLATVPVNMATGVAIAFAGEPIYSYYTAVPRLWGISVMQDQMLSGVIMWIPGSMMYVLAALILISRMIQTEADKEPLPESEWATDESMIAPGWKA
jgi:cytochrome c oxidase assembly factor CtaG